MNTFSLIRYVLTISQLCIALFAMNTVVNAGNNARYQVEVIVFKNNNGSAAREFFTPYPPLPEVEKALTLSPADTHHETPLKSYQVLPYPLRQLNRELNLIDKHPSYGVLLYSAWQQPANNEQKVLLSNLPSEIDASNLTATSNPNDGLTGWVWVRKGHYYTVEVSLDFHPITDSNVNYQRRGAMHYILQEKRRVMADELHYIDHPMYGVLLKLHPVVS